MKTPNLLSIANVKRYLRCVEEKRFGTIVVVCDRVRLCDDDAKDVVGDETVAK